MEILIVDKYADGTVLAVFGMLYIAIPVFSRYQSNWPLSEAICSATGAVRPGAISMTP
jgi:hypothetical protein